MRQISGLITFMLVALFFLVESKSTTGSRVLILLDNEDDKNLYTKFFGSLEGVSHLSLLFIFYQFLLIKTETDFIIYSFC